MQQVYVHEWTFQSLLRMCSWHAKAQQLAAGCIVHT
jgi:hypothetical protein